jgi:hypothetical protein
MNTRDEVKGTQLALQIATERVNMLGDGACTPQ